jgi:hypothetical protein
MFKYLKLDKVNFLQYFTNLNSYATAFCLLPFVCYKFNQVIEFQKKFVACQN